MSGSIGTHDATQSTDAVSLIEIGIVLLRWRRSIVLTTGVITTLAVFIILLLPRTFTSRATFIPQSDAESIGRLAGLAAQLGFTVPSGGPGQSPEFYAALTTSPKVLRALAESTYVFEGRTGWLLWQDRTTYTGTLAEIYEIDEENPARRRHIVLDILAQNIGSTADATTGIITIDVTTRWAGLSEVLAQNVVALITEFNQTARQTRAAAERRFVEERLADERAGLLRAENVLREFLENNRTFASSPALSFEHSRLQRDVDLRQQVVTGLAQSYEQARIEELRNTPVITLIEQPEPPAMPDRRRLPLKALATLVVTFLISAGAALFWEFSKSPRTLSHMHPREFDALKAAALNDLRQFLPSRRSLHGK